MKSICQAAKIIYRLVCSNAMSKQKGHPMTCLITIKDVYSRKICENRPLNFVDVNVDGLMVNGLMALGDIK